MNTLIMPPMPSDHPNITEPTPTTNAVGNRHAPQTPPRPKAVPRAATSSSPRNVPNPTQARARLCRAHTVLMKTLNIMNQFIMIMIVMILHIH